MQREYAIDMRHDLPSMSWRRFLVLVRGLSPHSATSTTLSSHAYMGARPPAQRGNVMQTPAQAERAFTALFGAPTQKQPD
jgi:hypothetical protein